MTSEERADYEDTITQLRRHLTIARCLSFLFLLLLGIVIALMVVEPRLCVPELWEKAFSPRQEDGKSSLSTSQPQSKTERPSQASRRAADLLKMADKKPVVADTAPDAGLPDAKLPDQSQPDLGAIFPPASEVKDEPDEDEDDPDDEDEDDEDDEE